ncbi:MAG: hypothetical protein JWQ55_5264, partial [Rhodopila sp.]|nr:hypothetical protein [Rhodopila sp.]
DHLMPAEDAPNLPISEVLHLHGQMMSVVSLDRLLPQQQLPEPNPPCAAFC